MQNIEDMMAMWKGMDSKLSSLLEENRRLADEIKKNKLRNSQEKLARKYRIFITLETICIPWVIIMLGLNPEANNGYKWPALIYFLSFFILEICIDSYLLYRLNRIDIYNDSIVEISRSARANWKIHKMGVLIGIPLAIGAVVLFCLALNCEPAMIWGIVVGAIIGVGIGLNEFFKFMKNYKSMSPS